MYSFAICSSKYAFGFFEICSSKKGVWNLRDFTGGNGHDHPHSKVGFTFYAIKPGSVEHHFNFFIDCTFKASRPFGRNLGD